MPSLALDAGLDSGGCRERHCHHNGDAGTSFIGRVFTSFPLNGGLPVFAVVENAADYEAGKKISVKEKHGGPRSNKGAEAPHRGLCPLRTSLDILRVTLNLARGNIEDQSVMAAAV
ncbi:MAG: hypothetical protein HY884_05020 [Deltaproteobacteria bacterium]|nr:hypothetical protein [Deltaproteobacteria bacterium]